MNAYTGAVKGNHRASISAVLFISLHLATLTLSLAQPATITTLRRDSSTTDAILNASVTPGPNDTLAWFQWGPTTNREFRTPPIQIPAGPNPIRISALLTNLVPYTHYYYQAVASNSLGMVTSPTYDESGFTTTPRLVVTSAPLTSWISIACSSNGASALASSGQSLYMSTNFGLTWNAVPAPKTNWGLVAMSASGTKLYASAAVWSSPGPIFVSHDSGLNWQPISDSRLWTGMSCSADGNKILACSDLVFVSHNAGLSWIQNSMPSNSWYTVTMSADGQKLAASRWSGSWRENGTLWTSTNGGAIWNPASSIQANSLVSAGDGSKLFANAGASGGSDYAFISTNWGLSWKPITGALRYLGCTATTYDGKKWFAGIRNTFDTMLYSSDSTESWRFGDDSSLWAVAVASSANGTSLYVVRSNGEIVMWQASAQLTIVNDTNASMITWPSFDLSSRLQQNSTLNPSDWTDLNEQPTLTNRIFRQTLSSTNDKTFYRVKTP